MYSSSHILYKQVLYYIIDIIRLYNIYADIILYSFFVYTSHKLYT